MKDGILRIKEFGCQMNSLDTTILMFSLETAGLARNLVRAEIMKPAPLMLFGDSSS